MKHLKPTHQYPDLTTLTDGYIRALRGLLTPEKLENWDDTWIALQRLVGTMPGATPAMKEKMMWFLGEACRTAMNWHYDKADLKPSLSAALPDGPRDTSSQRSFESGIILTAGCSDSNTNDEHSSLRKPVKSEEFDQIRKKRRSKASDDCFTCELCGKSVGSMAELEAHKYRLHRGKGTAE